MAQQGSLLSGLARVPSSCPATGAFSTDIVPTGGTGVTEGCSLTDCAWRPGGPCPRSRPVLHLHSWAWVHARVREGKWAPKGRPPAGYSGRAYTIMARPNPLRGELGNGTVRVLVPTGSEVEQMQALVARRRLGQTNTELLAAYRAAMESRWAEGGGLEPGVLLVHNTVGLGRVEHGDTLCCACSAADALAGRCHRAWAAVALVRAGWRVFLDRIEVVTGGYPLAGRSP